MGEPRTSSYGVRPPMFRLPDETRVGRVRLQVADLGRSIDYYEGSLGLRPLARAVGSAQLGTPDGRVLVELHERRGAGRVPRGGALGLFHFAILLPDRPAFGRFLQHAIAQGVVSGLADHAVSEASYLTDPDGLGIEVYADRPRSEWRTRPDGQLHITTEQLNVGDVIAAGRGVPWQSAPVGTKMGHIHLHVGDLDRAESFYHHGVGFDKIMWTYPGALFLSAGGYHHHLGTNTWSSGAPASEDQARLLSWDLETADPEAVVENLRAGGHSAMRHDERWRVADPWGTLIEIRTL